MAARIRIPLALLALCSCCLAASMAAAAPFTDVYFFGDSLTDTGNNGPVDVSAGLPLSYGYDPDRWTNAGGTVWSDGFAAGLGLGPAAAASSDGGNNYARGGDRADQMAAQVASFSSDVGGSADAGALYVVWAGGNDMLQGEDAASSASEVISTLLSLSALGAQSFLVANLPDFSPLAPGGGPLGPFAPIPAGADVWADDFNAALTLALSGLAGVTIFEFDAASLIDGLISDPVGNGYAAGLGLCSEDASCISGIGTGDFLMHDHLHMMSGPHDLIAAGALAAIPEPSTALLLSLGLIALGAQRRHTPAGTSRLPSDRSRDPSRDRRNPPMPAKVGRVDKQSAPGVLSGC